MKNVSGRGHMGINGYIPENADYRNVLLDENGDGRDPMSIPVDVLIAVGHGPRRTSSILGALGDVDTVEVIVRHKDLRGQCLSCGETAAHVKRCPVYDCPLWPYRMGRNPHNPRRGINPFKQEKNDV